MITLARAWYGKSWLDPDRIAPSLGLFAGHPADSEHCDGYSLFELAAPRAKPRRGWRAARSPSGLPVLLCGWIDNAGDLAGDLDLAECDAGQLYGAAFERWGDQADARINGLYASIMVLPDGRVRMSRAPLGSFPLFYASDSAAAVISSIPRPIFAAGWPERLHHDMVHNALAMLVDADDEQSYFEGVRRVPDGSIVYLSRDGARVNRWYSVLSLPETRLARDSDYVEAANALLADSVRNALSQAKRPAMSLSGGLDSAIAAGELLRQLPPGTRLPSYTFCPLREWSGVLPPEQYANERPYVEAFAAMHPALDAHFLDNRGIDFDHKARELFLAGGSAYPAMVSGAANHGVYMAAAKDGADWLFTASSGNINFSIDASWAWPEFLLRGKWLELLRLAAERSEDIRSVPRRIAALAIMPLLPQSLRSLLRSIVHPGEGSRQLTNPFLTRPPASPGTHSIAGARDIRSRREWLADWQAAFGIGAEIMHGYEQVFGIRSRDLTHYRPLTEFCMTIPTEQFTRNGEKRWLARRMGEGRMPEVQRLMRRGGRHNADWYPRLSARRSDMRSQISRIASQPGLADFIDTAKALAMLDDWPAADPGVGPQETALRFGLPATVLMSQFVDAVSGSNQY